MELKTNSGTLLRTPIFKSTLQAPVNISVSLESIKLSCKNCSLSELCLPRGLSDADIAEFESIVSPKRPLSRGETLYRSGDNTQSLYAVKSGALKSVINTPDGEEQIVGFHMPGEIVGLDGIDDSHSCSVVSLERSSVCELPLKEMDKLTAAIPSLNRELHAVMRREISQDQSMLLLLAQRTAENRLATFLLSISQRLGSRGFSETEFDLSMSRHDIANYLGLAAETVSRLIARFQDSGILKVTRRHVQIQDMDELKRRVGQCTSTEAIAQQS